MIEWALTPLSWCFHLAILFRHFLYDKKILKKKYAPFPIISIGNVMAGGAGKTQVTLLLAQQLINDFPIAILSRGYRGRAERARSPLVVDPQRHTPLQAGDEPWLLASRLKSVLVVVNKNRFKCALVAKNRGVKVSLLDDGMQHRQLHRDFEIVVIDGKTPFGSFLPKGRLREDLSRLKAADLIVFIGHPDFPLKHQVSEHSLAPQVVVTITQKGCFYLDGSPVKGLKGEYVGLFCGIGNPHRFVKTVEALGLHVVATHFAADHTIIKESTLHQFATDCKQKGANFLICTEKDKIKLSPQATPLPIAWLKVGLELIENQKAWIAMMHAIKQSVQGSPS